MNAGMIGGIIGSILGVAGGAFGAYCSIKNAQTGEERALMIKATLFICVGVATFLILLFWLPKPYDSLMWIPYGIALPLSIIYINKKQRQIRESSKK